jgi:hypothetical protein
MLVVLKKLHRHTIELSHCSPDSLIVVGWLGAVPINGFHGMALVPTVMALYQSPALHTFVVEQARLMHV